MLDLIAETSLETLSGNIGRLIVGLVVLAVIVIVGVLCASLVKDDDSGAEADIDAIEAALDSGASAETDREIAVADTQKFETKGTNVIVKVTLSKSELAEAIVEWVTANKFKCGSVEEAVVTMDSETVSVEWPDE